MPRIRLLLFVLSLSIVALNAPALADWHQFWQRVHLDWHRNNAWPDPFRAADANAVRAPFVLMTEKGWQRQNTIGHHHFDPNTQQLTEAGELKLRWILAYAPPEHRNVFVVRAYTDDATSIRIDSVQQTAARLIPTGQLPLVSASELEPRGWPADAIDAIGRKMQSSMPDPVLPAMQSTDGT